MFYSVRLWCSHTGRPKLRRQSTHHYQTSAQVETNQGTVCHEVIVAWNVSLRQSTSLCWNKRWHAGRHVKLWCAGWGGALCRLCVGVLIVSDQITRFLHCLPEWNKSHSGIAISVLVVRKEFDLIDQCGLWTEEKTEIDYWSISVFYQEVESNIC